MFTNRIISNKPLILYFWCVLSILTNLRSYNNDLIDFNKVSYLALNNALVFHPKVNYLFYLMKYYILD